MPGISSRIVMQHLCLLPLLDFVLLVVNLLFLMNKILIKKINKTILLFFVNFVEHLSYCVVCISKQTDSELLYFVFFVPF